MLNLPVKTNLFILFLSCLITNGSTAPNLLRSVCAENSTYNPNSTYRSHLNVLLASFSSTATNLNGRKFHNSTSGRQNDTVYGLYLCTGGEKDAVCQDCVEIATTEILKKCPNQTETIIWYDQCMLRYSNRSIFSLMEENPRFGLSNTDSVNDIDSFELLVEDSLSRLINRTAYNSSGDMFATAETKYNASTTIYNFAQCTPDLSGSDCEKCLRDGLSRLKGCCIDKQGARMVYPSCKVHYEIYPFYGDLAVIGPAPSPLPFPGKRKSTSASIIAITVPIGVVLMLSCFFSYYVLCRKTKKVKGGKRGDYNSSIAIDSTQKLDSLRFSLETLKAATDDFSDTNKIGEGGFGVVFKGILENGQEVAVKRLSKNSDQGVEQFESEIALLVKLQHRNLVRLLGYCYEEEEKLLVYEFVPNKSLDYNLFDPNQQTQLDWPKRYSIIEGISRGLLYLHEDSRLKIIHRDLKASNILLDANFNPKISDFGVARIFELDQTQASTRRIIGTYGYMSPEYAMHGQFSVKSDVYSFGVLVLEIVSGRKSSSFYTSEKADDLLSYAWRLWTQGMVNELVDPNLGERFSNNEVMRCVQIGLLCVQEEPNERPSLATVLQMLNTYSISLSTPSKPAFVFLSKAESDQAPSGSNVYSVFEGSFTELYPR